MYKTHLLKTVSTHGGNHDLQKPSSASLVLNAIGSHFEGLVYVTKTLRRKFYTQNWKDCINKEREKENTRPRAVRPKNDMPH